LNPYLFLYTITIKMSRANRPQTFRFRGHEIALEVENRGEVTLRNIPVYMVSVSILPGDIDDPEILFGAGLEAAYADVLQLARRQPDNEDRVQMGVYHEGIHSIHISISR